MTTAQGEEGDADERLSDERRPIRIIKFADGYLSADDEDAVGISADTLRTLAMRLLQAGFDPHRMLSLYKGGVHIGRISIGRAAGVCDG
jgi:hypothetical protein